MKHPKLIVYSDDRTIDYTIDWQYINHGIIKNISQLNKGINASSSTAEVTLSHDSPYTLPILEYENDLHAILYETVSGTNVPHFTGYISNEFSWTVDSHGAQAVKITLEDVGTKLLNKPFNSTVSESISGTATACFQTICSRVGITPTSSINNISTQVSTVAKEGETCQELLNALCKELGYSYYFTVNGQFEIKKLSTDDLSNVSVVNDSDLYDSIKLNKQARQYRGSRITYNKLKTRNNVLVYRDITNQSSSHKDCWIELNANDYYPDGTTSSHGTYIDAVDLAEGKEIISIDVNSLTPTVTWTRGTGTSSITTSGAKTLEVAVQCTSTGGFNKAVLSKLQATANISYVDSTEVIYGESDVGSKDYYEYDCRWLHTETPAIEFANFVAQYYQYCSREFTFKSKAHFTLGQIIKLHENTYSGLETYLIISAIKETDSTQIITYTANSISAFNYSKQTTNSSTFAPPSTVYVEIPDVELENITTEITANPDIFYKDLRDVNASTGVPNTSRIDLKYYYNASTTTPDTVIWDVRDNYNNQITLTYDNALHSEAHIDLARNTIATSIIAKAYVTGLQNITTQEKTINIIDVTVYNKNWGTINTLPSNYLVINGDYFLADQGLTGYTYGVPYVRVSGSWTQLVGNSVENVQRLMGVLGDALNSDLTVPAVSALYAWIRTLIVQDAVITNLFSKNITLLDPGSIKSSNYNEPGTEEVCEADTSNVDDEDFSFNETTFKNNTWGYGTYTIVCTSAYKSDPQSSEGSDDGSWSIRKDGVEKATTQNCAGLSTYGISISFDGEAFTTSVGDYITVVYEERTIEGQGFYLGSDGTLDCNNANAHNLNISGDSFFHGSFDCDVIATKQLNPTTLTISQDGNDWQAAERMVQQMINAGWIPDWTDSTQTSEMFTATTTNFTSDLGYIRVQYGIQQRPSKKYANIRFYAKNRTSDYRMDGPFEFYNGNDRYQTNTSTYISTVWHNAGLSALGGFYRTNGLTIQLSKGGNKLWLDVPSSDLASPLTTGMVYMKRTTDTIDGVTGHYLFVKD